MAAGFVDIATYDEQEKYTYGGPNASARFVRRVQKSTWFTLIPTVLSSTSNRNFGQEWSANISRAGDYMVNNWLRAQWPEVRLSSAMMAAKFTYNGAQVNKYRVRLTRNAMHNLIKEASISFNDLTGSRFDSYHLDFWAAFTVPAGKVNGYANMIGNIASLVDPYNAPQFNADYPAGTALPSVVLNLPLPFPHTRDSGVALPVAALPYNEMRINFHFRNWQELYIIDDLEFGTSRPAAQGDFATTPELSNVQVWATYAIVSNDERRRIGKAPRDILIEQVQTAPRYTFNPSQNSLPTFDIRFSHAVKALFFAVRNKTNPAEWSNYTCGIPYSDIEAGTDFAPAKAVDPIESVAIIYESTMRQNLGADYYALVNPFYHAPVIPTETGYHMYSYALDMYDVDPQGSTNYGKLANVSLQIQASQTAIDASSFTVPTSAGEAAFFRQVGWPSAQTFELIVSVINNNVIRVSGGAMGFPVL